MADYDLIRRGDALKVARDVTYGDILIDEVPDAIAAIPAVQPTVSPDVAALVDAVKNTLTGYDQWANCASGTPEDTIAAAAMFARVNWLRAALSAWEGLGK